MRPVLLLTLLSAVPAALAAQGGEPFDFYGRGPYRQAVPRPSDVLEYGAGERHTQYAEQQGVLDRLIAAAPDRVRTEVIGRTEEGRAMRVLIISAPENLARLDEIRTDLARLADPLRTSAADAAAIAARTPAAVFLSYSIHGNEPAGYEAAVWVAYQLLASDEPATLEVLRDVVTILNPSANPDGHERFAVWYNSLSLGTDEPFGYEAGEPWDIQGRFGHYRFDMNRDLIAQSHAPTRAMLGAIMRWHPQVVVDHHSTVQPFFFAPAALPLNANLPPHAARWLEAFGRGNAAAFDRYGWQYYVRDVFDLFYPGYWDSGPSLHGATGMTYETDGGPELAIRQDDGTVITFRDGIAHHLTASLATVATAAAHREQRLRDYYDFHRTAIDELRGGRMKRVVILPDNDHTNAARLAVLLLRHGVEVRRLTQSLTSAAAQRYLTPGAPSRQTFPAGALVVDLGQAQGRMAKTLLEPRADLDSTFARRQLAKFERNRRRGEEAEREGYDFYDVTAWSLPYTLGLEAYWTEDLPAAGGDMVALPDADDPVRALAPAGGVSTRAQSAYLFRNDRQAAAELALALLREGFVLSAAGESFRADSRDYPRGTFVARVARNPETVHQRVLELARETGVPVEAVQSAFPDSGRVGIGSESVRPVFAPRVLVAMGAGISQTGYGATWHFLERELRHPFTAVALGAIGRMSTMADYNVLIIPAGNSGAMRRELGESGTDRLKRWVQDGGTVIGFGGGAELLGKGGIGLSTVERVGAAPDSAKAGDAKRDSLPAGAEHTPPLPSPTGGGTDRPEDVPGSIFRATLDPNHWLTAGYERTHLAVMLDGGTMFKPSEKGDNPVVFVGDSLHLSGFVWPGNTERLLKGTVWAASERLGRGHVVLFASDPLFRAFWRGPARLLTNAMLLGTGR